MFWEIIVLSDLHLAVDKFICLFQPSWDILHPPRHREYQKGKLPTESIRLTRIEQVKMLDGKPALPQHFLLNNYFTLKFEFEKWYQRQYYFFYDSIFENSVLTFVQFWPIVGNGWQQLRMLLIAYWDRRLAKSSETRQIFPSAKNKLLYTISKWL